MVATIAPGPASSGVPSGTSAMLEVTCWLGVVGLAGEQFQRDQHQQQAAGGLQRGQVDVQVVEQGLPGDGEDHDDPERQRDRLPGGPVAVPGRQRAGQREEDRHHARRVDDDQQGHEDLAEQLEIHPINGSGGRCAGRYVGSARSDPVTPVAAARSARTPRARW